MSKQPTPAQVDAARNAAQRTFDAIGDMEDVALEIKVVSADDATTTNSLDQGFLDYLATGSHLNESFLANAK